MNHMSVKLKKVLGFKYHKKMGMKFKILELFFICNFSEG